MTEPTAPMQIKLGSFEAKSAAESVKRMTALLWGPPGSGKTTLAATAPGERLLINFDPDGPASIAGRSGTHVVDLSGEAATSVIPQSILAGPFGIENTLKAAPQIKTVIIDSMTSYEEKALAYGVSQISKATLVNPTQAGWGYRTRYTTEFIRQMLVSTNKLGVNCIFIAHEGQSEKNDEGIVLDIPIMLGGKTQVDAPLKISEVWNVTDINGKKRIAVRPCRSRKTMKTRMFITGNEVEFDWNFDADKWTGDTIEQWYNQWKENGYAKIPLPKGKATTTVAK